MSIYLGDSNFDAIQEDIKQFYIEKKFELILVKINDKQDQKFNSPNFILLYASSLLYAGYFIQTINFIDNIFRSKVLDNEKIITIQLLLIKSEALFYCNEILESFLVIEKLEQLIQENQLSTIQEREIIYAQFFIAKSYLIRLEGHLNQADLLLEEAINVLSTLKHSARSELVLAKSLMIKGFLYGLRRMKSESLEYLNKSLKIVTEKNDLFSLSEVYYYLGLNYLNFYELEKAMNYFSKNKEINNSLSNSNRTSWSLLLISVILMKGGKLQKAKESIDEFLSYTRLYKDGLVSNLMNEILGDIYYFSGELEESLFHYHKAELDFQEQNLNHFQGQILNKIASMKSLQRLFDEAFYYHKKALKIFEKTNDSLKLARTYCYISESEFLKGDFDSAFSSSQKAIDIYQDLDNITGLAFSYLNLAKISLILNHHLVGSYYTEAISLFKKSENDEGYVESLIGYGIYLQDQDTLTKAQFYFNIATELIHSLKGNYIKLIERIYNFGLLTVDYSLGKGYGYVNIINELLMEKELNKRTLYQQKFFKAFKLKLSKNIRDHAKSLDLFEELCNSQEIQDFYTFVLSYLNRFELVIFELKIFGTEELLNEANNILEELISLTSINNLSVWSAQALALKGELALVQLAFDDAKYLFNEALQIAKLKKLKRLEIRLHNQLDEILVKINKLSLVNEETLSIQERLKIADLSVFDTNKYYNRMKTVEELPAYLSIISTKGFTIYSYNFNIDKNGRSTDQLISGFIIAINSVIQKMFSSTGFLERIKHKEYTLSINNLKDSLYICYGYKGQSYSAQTKLENLISRLKTAPYLDYLLKSSELQRTLSKKDTSHITQIVNELFFNNQNHANDHGINQIVGI